MVKRGKLLKQTGLHVSLIFVLTAFNACRVVEIDPSSRLKKDSQSGTMDLYLNNSGTLRSAQEVECINDSSHYCQPLA